MKRKLKKKESDKGEEFCTLLFEGIQKAKHQTGWSFLDNQTIKTKKEFWLITKTLIPLLLCMYLPVMRQVHWICSQFNFTQSLGEATNITPSKNMPKQNNLLKIFRVNYLKKGD